MRRIPSIAVMILMLCAGAGVTASERGPFEQDTPWLALSRIDELAARRWGMLGVQPARDCSDAVFVRRIHLDVIGTLPTAAEARQFIDDRSPDKRAVLIDRLLERAEFADYWAMKWGEMLRIKAEFPINLWPNGAQAYHRWVHTCIRDNLPYDRFARDLLTANGSNFRVPPVNFWRAVQSREPEALAQAVALTLMGTRAEAWPKERLTDMGAFFARLNYKATTEWKEEIVAFDPGLPAAGTLVFPDGTKVTLSSDQDPREAFADWLLRPNNPWFARNIVNRVWCWLLGRGIVHEVDDLRDDNPPSNPELLAWVEEEFVAKGYDLKHLYRLILNSRVYQLSSIPRDKNPLAGPQFAVYPVRRLEAEVLIDGLNQITGTTENYSSLIPEPFSYIPEGTRSIALVDGSISSSFLEMFGRPPRDTGLESERNNRPTAAQQLHLLNSSHVQRKIEQGPALQDLFNGPGQQRHEMVEELYLTILSRRPSPREIDIATDYMAAGTVSRREAAIDLAWALINSSEFLFRH